MAGMQYLNEYGNSTQENETYKYNQHGNYEQTNYSYGHDRSNDDYVRQRTLPKHDYVDNQRSPPRRVYDDYVSRYPGDSRSDAKNYDNYASRDTGDSRSDRRNYDDYASRDQANSRSDKPSYNDYASRDTSDSKHDRQSYNDYTRDRDTGDSRSDRKIYDDYSSREPADSRSDRKGGRYEDEFGRDYRRDRYRSRSRSRSRDRRRSRDRSRERRRDGSSESRGRRDRSRERRHREDRDDESRYRRRYRDEEGYQDESSRQDRLPPSSTVYMQNLHLEATEADIEDEIKKDDLTPRSVSVIRERNGESRGFAFVEFDNSEVADKWINKLQRTIVIKGQRSSLTFSKSRRSQETHVPDWVCNTCKALNFGCRSRVSDKRFVCFKCKAVQTDIEGQSENKTGGNENDTNIEPTNVLMLRGMDFSTSEDKIRMEIVKLTSKVLYDVRLIRDKITDMSRGFAFVELENSEDAKELFDTINLMEPPFEIDNRRITVGYARHGYNAPLSGKKKQLSQVPKEIVAQNAVAQASAAKATLEYSQSMVDTQYAPVSTGQTTQQQQTQQQQMQQGFVYDPTSGYYYDANSGLYYDSTTGYYYNGTTQQWLQWDGYQYKVVSQDGSVAGNTQTNAAYSTQQTNAAYSAPQAVGTGQANTPTQKNIAEEQQGETVNIYGQKPKNARKIAKDMERWAKKLNNQNETRKAAVKQAQEELKVLEQKEEELRKKISLEKSITSHLSSIATGGKPKDGIRSLFVPDNDDEGNVLKLGSALTPSAPQKPRGGLVADFPLDDDDIIIDESMFVDLTKMACLLCQRQLTSKENLTKHLQMSQLHKQNLEKYKESKRKR